MHMLVHPGSANRAIFSSSLIFTLKERKKTRRKYLGLEWHRRFTKKIKEGHYFP